MLDGVSLLDANTNISNNNLAVIPDRVPHVLPDDWYVVTTKPGQSVEVARRLAGAGFNGFSPLYISIKVTKQLQKINVELPVFPRYAFAKWDGEDPYIWHEINDTRDVTGIMGGWLPMAVRTGQVESLINRADKGWVIRDIDDPSVTDMMMRGLSVEITRGSFSGKVGTVESWDSKKGRVEIKLPLLGRRLVLKLDLGACSVSDLPIQSAENIAPSTDRTNDSFRQRRRPRHLWRKSS